jgi:hypothetical protein
MRPSRGRDSRTHIGIARVGGWPGPCGEKSSGSVPDLCTGGCHRTALEVERRVILQLRNERAINDEVHRRIQHDIDLAEARLRYSDRLPS